VVVHFGACKWQVVLVKKVHRDVVEFNGVGNGLVDGSKPCLTSLVLANLPFEVVFVSPAIEPLYLAVFLFSLI